VVVAIELVPDVAMTKRRTMTTAAAAEVFRLERSITSYWLLFWWKLRRKNEHVQVDMYRYNYEHAQVEDKLT
jgi:hypothetical protein